MMVEWHWLRPYWLLGLPALALLWWQLYRHYRVASGWNRVVDPQLRPYVIESGAPAPQRWPLWLLGAAWVLCTLLLAGPVWDRHEVPVYSAQDALVLVLDVSRSMDIDDLQPTRLTRAKYKLSDLLTQNRDLQVGLLVFSEVPYIIAPLTDDVATVEAFLPALSSSVVPVQGSQLAPAIERAHQLLQQSGVANGSIILLTDAAVDERAIEIAATAAGDGFPVSVLGVGTVVAQPVREADGSFLQDRDGRIVMTTLDVAGLQRLARSGQGVYTTIQPNGDDITALNAVVARSSTHRAQTETSMITTHWIEYGPWLLPVLLLSVLGLYRRGRWS